MTLEKNIERWKACKRHHWEHPAISTNTECKNCGAPLAWQVAGNPSADTIRKMAKDDA